MKTKHTKGEWGITKRDRGDYIIMCPSEIGIHLALVHNYSDNNAEANAKLIAAAPENLQENIDNLVFLKTIEESLRLTDQFILLHECKARIKMTEKAIKKATE